jgi:hypothetical protein
LIEDGKGDAVQKPLLIEDDDVIPFADSKSLVRKSGLLATALIEVGTDRQLADPEPLEAMLKECGLS